MKSAADKQRASNFYKNASAKEVTVVEDIMAGRPYWQAVYGLSEAKESAFYVNLSASLDLQSTDPVPVALAIAYKDQPLKHFIQAIVVRVREIFAQNEQTSAA